MSRKKILHIEKLRGLSILLVFLFHMELPGFQNGSLGEDVFFVISGFLMATLYGTIGTRQQIESYLTRRMSRILPAYYVVIIVTIAASCFLLLPHEIRMVVEQGTWSAFFIPNIGFWTDTAYFDYTNFRPLLNLWSLGVEVQFYLLFPLLLFIERRSPTLLFILVIVSFLEFGLLNYIDPRTAFFLLPGRLWEFMAGFYIVRMSGMPEIEMSKLNLQVRNILGGAAIVLLLALLIASPSFSIDNTFFAICALIFLTMAAVSLGFSIGSESSPISQSLTLLGKYSYSIYLVHFPVIVLVNYSPFGGTVLSASGAGSVVTIVALTACLSFLLYNFVEIKTRTTLTGVQVCKIAAAFCAAIILLSNPLSNLSQYRLGPEVFKISSSLNDRDSFRCTFVMTLLEPFAASCQINKSLEDAEKRFLLVGDSHADAIKKPLAELLEANNQSLRLLKENSAIDQNNPVEDIISEALECGVDAIIIHSLPLPDEVAAVEQLVLAVQPHLLSIVYIDPVPIYSFDVPKKLLTDFQATGELQSLGKSLQSHLEEYQELHAGIEQLSRSYENFIRDRTGDFLCATGCLLSNEAGEPYYYDSNHLTLTGAALLEPIYQAISEL